MRGRASHNAISLFYFDSSSKGNCCSIDLWCVCVRGIGAAQLESIDSNLSPWFIDAMRLHFAVTFFILCELWCVFKCRHILKWNHSMWDSARARLNVIIRFANLHHIFSSSIAVTCSKGSVCWCDVYATIAWDRLHRASSSFRFRFSSLLSTGNIRRTSSRKPKSVFW